jgi:hypothetical protein
MDRIGFVVPSEVMNTQVKLIAGENKENYKLKLTPVGSILGRVVDAGGSPLEGVSVEAIRGGRAAQSGTTDDRGQYRIGGLAPGKYRVRAKLSEMPLPPEIRTDGTKEIHYAATYHPGVIEERAARRIEVGPATDVPGIDISLVPTPIVRAAGTVAGVPEGTKNVMLQVRKLDTSTGAQVKPDGSFEIWRLDPGKYTLRANIFGSGIGDMLTSLPLEVEVAQSDIENLGLRMGVPDDIRGQIVFDDEMAKRPQPKPDQQQTKQQNQRNQQMSPTRIMLRDVPQGYGTKQETVADDGSFTLSQVQPGKYLVSVLGYPAYVKSVTLGKTETSGPELDLSNGANGATLSVTLASTFGTITGIARDNNGPARGARIAMIDPRNANQSSTTTAKEDGTFTFPRVSPGRKLLMPYDSELMSSLMNSPDPEDYDERVEQVEVSASETVMHDMKVPSVN